jgi:opacity protein-like surface antigen
LSSPAYQYTFILFFIHNVFQLERVRFKYFSILYLPQSDLARKIINFKRLITTSVTTSLLVILPNSFVHADDSWSNRVSILFGQKHLQMDIFDEKKHSAFGIGFDIKKQDWPVSIAIDLVGSGKETNNTNSGSDVATGELHLGIRKHWLFNNIEPYIGGGANLSVTEITNFSGDSIGKQDDDGIAYWVSTGISWKFDNNIVVGADIRYSDAKAELFNSTIKTSGVYSMVTVGYQF